MTRKRLGEPDDDVAYWRQRPPEERLEMLEELRRRHHGWDHGTRPELQRVHRTLTEDLTRPGRVVQLGYPPLRIDLMTSIDGVDFEEAYRRRVEVEFSGVTVPFIAIEDLRRNKRASGRAQDLADLEALSQGQRRDGELEALPRDPGDPLGG